MKIDYAQILARRRLGKTFETEDASRDPVLKWYRETGKSVISDGFDWEKLISRRIGVDMPKACSRDEDFSRWLSAVSDYGNPKWQDAARQIIKDTLNTDLFEFAGMGASKVTLVSKSGKALKFGRSRGGAREEILRSVKYSEKYCCFPRMFDYAEDLTSYVCERAGTPKPEDFQRLLGFRSAKALADTAAGQDPRLIVKILNNPSEPKWQSVADLVRFFADVGRLTDIYESNWGLAVREGQSALIVTDYDV